MLWWAYFNISDSAQCMYFSWVCTLYWNYWSYGMHMFTFHRWCQFSKVVVQICSPRSYWITCLFLIMYSRCEPCGWIYFTNIFSNFVACLFNVLTGIFLWNELILMSSNLYGQCYSVPEYLSTPKARRYSTFFFYKSCCFNMYI